ncbi:SUKH-3 domain-containing protein [Anabaena azotica]|uniref:SUKH-3 domain-containing protein n=1 Tax=Anabaena azotica FACHB-119 TaxID=947527 RepID=A0ABR8CVQ7_9NOST|nr:SUKH-3 domain-containing protein [Anabaena azotica]MBD2499004.1 SUKH-3 domain-containing protein [Anabaena azotica FACHB-119]
MAVFSEETTRLLEQAEWHESRNIDTSEYKEILESEGYSIYPNVMKFLSCFGGLHVKYPHKRVPQLEDDFHFNVPQAVGNIYPERVQDYSDRIGVPLCVIGESNRGYMILMMTPEGQVYAGYDDFLVFVGDSGIDAIEALCSGRELAEIPFLESDE